MDFSKVKLVVTDMDGTLLNSKGKVSSKFFNLFNEIKKQQIHFIAASGRQYQSIVHKLAPIKNDITIIAENGGLAKQGDNELLITNLQPKKIKNNQLVVVGFLNWDKEHPEAKIIKTIGEQGVVDNEIGKEYLFIQCHCKEIQELLGLISLHFIDRCKGGDNCISVIIAY